MLTVILILVLLAFVVPLIYLIWLRNSERYGRERWLPLLKTFGVGATTGIFLAALFEWALIKVYDFAVAREIFNLADFRLFVLAVVIAPFVEEFTKGTCIRSARTQIDELEDGLIYGASAGLGFAATENLLYEVAAIFTEGLFVSIGICMIRLISSTLVHASATAILGYGLSKKILLGSTHILLLYYLCAVGLHSLFNYLVIFGTAYFHVLGIMSYVVSLGLAIICGFTTFIFVHRKINELDLLL